MPNFPGYPLPTTVADVQSQGGGYHAGLHNGERVAANDLQAQVTAVKSTADDAEARVLVVQQLPDAKGDVITATAADTLAKLTVGADGQFLMADASTATGLLWQYPRLAVCQVRKAAPQSLTNNTATALTFDTEDLDPLNWHAGGAPTLITPTIAGWYRATVSTDPQTDTDYTRMLIELQKNTASTTPKRSFDPQPRVTTGDPIGLSWPLVQMNGSSDTLRIVVTQVNTDAQARTIDAVLLVELVYPT